MSSKSGYPIEAYQRDLPIQDHTAVNIPAAATPETTATSDNQTAIMNAAVEELRKQLVEALTTPVSIDPVGPKLPEAAAPPTAEERPKLPEAAAPATAEEQAELQKYLPLYKATVDGDWKTAEKILREDINALKSSIAFTTETALHVAIGTGSRIDFLRKLIDVMPNDLLDIKMKDDVTPLHVAALSGNTKAAKMLVARRPDLVYERTTAGLLPIHLAADSGHRETLAYLISKTHNLFGAYSDQSGIKLLFYIIDAGFYDVALGMVKKYPDLATVIEEGSRSYALQKIVGKVHVFSRSSWFLHRNKYMMRKQALQLVEYLGKIIKHLDDDLKAKSIYSAAMVEAIHAGTSEAIQFILQEFPEIVVTALRGREAYALGLLVENRCVIVFHLIFHISSLNREFFLEDSDYEKNNILHRTAKLAPLHKLNLVAGAALQMQCEMQWYKEVEKLLAPLNREAENNKGDNPRMIFTRDHENLKKEAMKWMKDTATSSSIVAALIATVVFAAAITVPGGNKEESGLPVFAGRMPFLVFAVSDAISLFASITSLLIFLTILTSRFAEDDFLSALPRRLIIGLISLFISILFMMSAFGATLHVVYGQKKPTIVIPVLVLLGSLPVFAFGILQFPLLMDVISITCFSGNLGNQIKRFRALQHKP